MDFDEGNFRGRLIENSKREVFSVFPFFGYASTDWPESKLYNLTCDGNATPLPCGYCFGPRDRLHELTAFFRLRTVQEMKFAYRKFLFRARIRQKKLGKDQLKQISLKPLENKLWWFMNPYVQRVPDLVHHFNLGLIKLLLTYLVAYFQANGKSVERFDYLFQKLKINGLKQFTNGISHLTFLKGYEYEDALFYLPHVLHNMGIEKIITDVPIALIEVLLALEKQNFTIPDLKALVQKQKNLEEAFSHSGLKEYCTSDFNLVKFHDLTHHVLAILLFEDPCTYSTQVGEYMNGVCVRTPYQMGNKKDNEEFDCIQQQSF